MSSSENILLQDDPIPGNKSFSENILVIQANKVELEAAQSINCENTTIPETEICLTDACKNEPEIAEPKSTEHIPGNKSFSENILVSQANKVELEATQSKNCENTMIPEPEICLTDACKNEPEIAEPKSTEDIPVSVTKMPNEVKFESKPNAIEQQTAKPESSENTYDPQNVHYEGDVAVYTDPNSRTRYNWDKEKNEWILQDNRVYGFEDDTHVYTDSDGGKYFWDKAKNAWFPKIDDDFMARYQISYGFIDNTNIKVEKPVEVATAEEIKKSKKLKGEKRKASEPTWFEVDKTQNTNVYVSNLPTDINENDFVDLMQKCGLVMKDVQSGQFKVKLYKEPGSDVLKGDGLCTYIKIESVDLALSVLDGYDFKGKKIKIERAKFELKGDYDPKLKPKMKKKKEKLKIKKAQEKLFDWRPEKQLGERAKHEKVVIVRNLFDPAIFDTEVGLILEFQQDLREECSKYGEVKKVIIYDRHPEGIAQINMGSPEEADQVVSLLHQRWFMKRQLTAEIWDGKTKFKIAETDSEINQRLNKWDEFLESGEDKKQSEKIQNNSDEK